jgi:hypothetical protein
MLRGPILGGRLSGIEQVSGHAHNLGVRVSAAKPETGGVGVGDRAGVAGSALRPVRRARRMPAEPAPRHSAGEAGVRRERIERAKRKRAQGPRPDGRLTARDPLLRRGQVSPGRLMQHASARGGPR